MNTNCYNYYNPITTMPHGVRSLLGLSLNYCIQTSTPNNDLENTFERLTDNIRRTSIFCAQSTGTRRLKQNHPHLSALY